MVKKRVLDAATILDDLCTNKKEVLDDHGHSVQAKCANLKMAGGHSLNQANQPYAHWR